MGEEDNNNNNDEEELKQALIKKDKAKKPRKYKPRKTFGICPRRFTLIFMTILFIVMVISQEIHDFYFATKNEHFATGHKAILFILILISCAAIIMYCYW